MKKKRISTSPLKNEYGVSTVMVAILSTVFIGFAALAIDYGHLYVVRNELRNAADAGALAGARVLYTNDGTAVNPGANAVALAAATANTSEKLAGSPAPVEVNAADIERGHWSFTNNSFTPNDSLAALDLWNYTTQQLDVNTNFINAVRVTARRQSSPSIISYFAGLFGVSQFAMQQKAVAWVGFAGPIPPGGVDQPFAICEQAISSGGIVTCNIGRMLNSGSNANTHNTAAWTNFTQSPCQTANNPSVSPLICANGNPMEIFPGQGVGTTGGTDTSILNNMINCWKNSTCGTTTCTPTNAWGPINLLVIDCPGNNPGNCSTVKGVVSLTILWMTDNGNDPQYNNVPRQMSATIDQSTVNWTCSNSGSTRAERQECWNQFVTRFNIQNVDNQLATWQNGGYAQKSTYFLPTCDYTPTTGGPGGNNYGTLAKQPRLVDWSNPYSKF